MSRKEMINKFVKEYGLTRWQIVGYGKKRVILRYLMTNTRSYCKRRLFDRLVEHGRIEITSEV